MACSSKRRYEDAENEDQQFSIDDVGEILSSYNVNVFDSNLNTVEIQQDQFRRHEIFKQREEDTQLNNNDQGSNDEDQTTAPKETKKNRGARALKFATKCQARSQARYKRRNGIIKTIRDLKDERMIYGTTQELISKFKSFGLEDFSVESTNESSLANVSSESLVISSPSKPSKIGSKEKVRKKEKESQNYCRICDVKYDTKLDKDFYSPWIGCNVKPCNYLIHAFCLGFVVDEPSELPNIFCRKHHPTQMPSHRRIIKKTR